MNHQNPPPTSTRPKKQRRRVLDPTDALHEILTSHITPISSQQEDSHISTVVNVQDLLNQNGRDTAQTGRSRRTQAQSNDTNRMTAMNAATYGNYAKQQYDADMRRSWCRPSPSDIKKCHNSTRCCPFHLFPQESFKGLRPSQFNTDVPQCGVHHVNVLLFMFAHLLYPKPSVARNQRLFASGLEELRDTFGQHFELYHAKIRYLIQQHPVGKALSQKLNRSVGQMSDSSPHFDIILYEEHAYERVRSTIEKELLIFMGRRYCNLPFLLQTISLLNKHTAASSVLLLSADNHAVSPTSAYRYCNKISEQHPSVIAEQILMFVEDGRFLNWVADNMQQMNLSQGMANRMASTNHHDINGQHFALTMIDCLIRRGELPESIGRSTLRLSLLRLTLSSLDTMLPTLEALLIDEADLTRENETRRHTCVPPPPVVVPVVEAIVVEDEQDEQEVENDILDDDEPSNEFVVVNTIDSEGKVIQEFIEQHDDGDSSSEETEEGSGSKAEEEPDAMDVDDDDYYEDRYNKLKKGDIVSIQMFGDSTFFPCKLVEKIDLDFDDTYPEMHWIVEFTECQSPGVLLQNDNYIIQGEESAPPPRPSPTRVPTCTPPNSKQARERAVVRERMAEEFFRDHPDARRTSGKSTSWKDITGMWPAFYSASKINEMALALFQYFLTYACADPNYRRLICLTCDAETYNFVRHILHRAQFLHPTLDFGFVLLVPELWHAVQSGLLSIFDERPYSGVLHKLVQRLIYFLSRDAKDLTEARWGLKHKQFSSLHLFAGCFHEAWLAIREQIFYQFTPLMISQNIDLQVLVTALDYSLKVILEFLKDITANPKAAEAALRDLFNVLRMNNARTYSTIILKFISDLQYLKEWEPDFYTYAVEQFNAMIGVCIEHMHAAMAGMYNPLAGIKRWGFASPAFHISRIKLIRDIKQWHASRFVKTKLPTSTYQLMPYQHKKYEQHRQYCQAIIWQFFTAAYHHLGINLEAPENAQAQTIYVSPTEHHKFEVTLSIYSTQYNGFGFALAKTTRIYDYRSPILLQTFDLSNFKSSKTARRMDGFVFKLGSKGLGFYRDSAQIAEFMEDIDEGDDIDVKNIIQDGQYTMVSNVIKGSHKSGFKEVTTKRTNICVSNGTIKNFPHSISLHESTKSVSFSGAFGKSVMAEEFVSSITLTFYAQNYVLWLKEFCDSQQCKTDDTVQVYPCVAYGPCSKQPKRRAKDMGILRVGDKLIAINGESIRDSKLQLGSKVEMMLEYKYQSERDKKPPLVKEKMILTFQTDRPVPTIGGSRRKVISSHTLGKYHANCSITTGTIDTEYLKKKVESAISFKKSFLDGCKHNRIVKLDKAINEYEHALRKLRQFGMSPTVQRGESRMYRETLKILLRTLEERYIVLGEPNQNKRTKITLACIVRTAEKEQLIDIIQELDIELAESEKDDKDKGGVGGTAAEDGENDGNSSARRIAVLEEKSVGTLQWLVANHCWNVVRLDLDQENQNQLLNAIIHGGLSTLRAVAADYGTTQYEENGSINEENLRNGLISQLLKRNQSTTRIWFDCDITRVAVMHTSRHIFLKDSDSEED